MGLSICCATARPSRAAAVLAPLREVADEIVVAVDVSEGEQDLTPLGAVADRLFQIELDTFPEPAMAWLHAQCSGDWILRIDDDEVLDTSLLEQLPELTRARDVVQYWLARRWLYPDPGHWLEEWPWFPDFQGRLVRNDAQLWFPGLCHSSVVFTMPARYLDSGIYHLAHLLSSREERERKVARYLAVDPALRVTGADPYLSSYYLPERHPGARSTAVDSCDRDAIDALIADDHRPFRISVRNEGTGWWPGGEYRRPLIRVAYKWLDSQGGVFEPEGARTALPHPVAPGASCLVAMNVTAPATAGRYLLAPDLVHEHVRWFQCRSQPVEMLVTAPQDVPR